MKKNQKKKKEVRNPKGKTSAAPVSRFRRIARWTVIGALALFALLCTGGAWFARHPPAWLAQNRQSLPSVVFKPLGFGDWKPTAATVTGLVAKEEVVANFGIMYAYDDKDGEEELEENGDQIWDRVAEDFNAFSGGHGKLAAYTFMIFNLLCAPCFAAIGAIKREMNSRKWTWFAIGYQCGFAWVTAFIVWQLGRLFAGGMNVVGLILALVMLALICWQLFKPYKEAQKLTVK